MKKIVFTLVLLLFLPYLALAQEGGQIILELDETDYNPKKITIQDQVEKVVEVGTFFNKNYPDAKIDEDFSEDVAKFFPSLSRQEIYDREQLIRDGVKIYRWVNKIINDVKAKILAPKPPPLIVADEDYDTPYTAEYIESDEPIIIQDFKKVLSYGSNPRDIEAYQAKMERDARKKNPEEMSKVERFLDNLSKVEAKKILFYDVIYESPLTGSQGIGRFVEENGIKARIVSDTTAVGNQEEIRGVIQIILPKDKSILAFDMEPYKKPVFDLAYSHNIKDFSIFSPKPRRFINEEGKSVIAYFGAVNIPFIVKTEDLKTPVKIKAKLDFNLCDTTLCQPAELIPYLDLPAMASEMSSMNFFVNQAFNQIPSPSSKELEIKSVTAEDSILRVVLEVHKTIDKFEIYAESKDGIEFNRPRVSINNGIITARFKPIKSDEDILDKEFIITAAIDYKNSIRQTWTAASTSLFDVMSEKLSLGLVLFGVLGGFILNFMPCVFPVLSIKLLAMTNIGAKRELPKDFWYTVLGIFVSFLIIAVILSLMKYAGMSIGWGMQFQSAGFIVFMTFVITVFMAQIWGLINISVKNKRLNFLTGTLAVLMATPCTAPYLGTAIGFALAGSFFDIFVIMLSVALGLSLPYIVIALIPNFALLMPKPGAWMEKLNKFMLFMLFLTIVWLLSILAAQTSVSTAIWLGVAVLVSLIVLWFRKLLLDETEDKIKDKEQKKIVWRFFNLITLGLFAGLFIWSLSSVSIGFNKQNRNNNTEINTEEIKNLVEEGKIVLVKIGANWCLTCTYNDAFVFQSPSIQDLIDNKKIEIINIDWTNYDEKTLEFMEKFGRKGLPFYIIFSPSTPDGIVLPEVLNERELVKIISSVI